MAVNAPVVRRARRRRRAREQFSLARVPSERGSVCEGGARVIQSPQLRQQVAADGKQQVVVRQHGGGGQLLDQFERGLRAKCHANRYRAV